MAAPESRTPPAATEGADCNSAGEQVQGKRSSENAQSPHFWQPSTLSLEGDAEELFDEPSPVAFTQPPGLVGELANYIYMTGHRPMLEAAVLAALGLIAGIVGRSYNFNNGGLNLYLLLLAPTGRGKAAMQSGIDRLMSEVQKKVPFAEEFIGPDTFASGQALVRVVSENPCFLSVFGEFGLKLKALSDPRANTHEVEQLRVLLDLYNKSGQFDYLRPRKYSDKDKNTKTVRSPAVSILGESTPDIVYENLSHDDIRSGLLPRFLLLECTSSRPPRNPNAGEPPPDRLVTQLTDLVTGVLTMSNNKAYCNVQVDPAAVELLAEVEAEIDAIYNEHINPTERELWNRAVQNIGRVAALLAVGCNPYRPVVTPDCARWAINFVCNSVETLVRKFRSGLIGSGEVRQEAEIKRYIAEYMRMTPERKRTYKVPHSLCESTGCIGVDYIKRRARSCSAFTQDRRGLNMAVEQTLAALCKSGWLVKLQPREAYDRFGLRGDMYALANG